MAKGRCIFLKFRCWWLLAGLAVPALCFSQTHQTLPNVYFHQLTTAEGLTDNYVGTMAVDRNGYLWLGTGEGLNRFDGSTVEKYFAAEYPQLRSDGIVQLLCDADDRLWVLTSGGGLTLIDEHRKFHRIGIYQEEKFIRTRRILWSDSKGVIVLTRFGHFVLRTGLDINHTDSLTSTDFIRLPFEHEEVIHKTDFTYVEQGHRNQVWYVTADSVFLADYQIGKFAGQFACEECKPICPWDENEMLFLEKTTSRLYSMNIATGVRTRRLDNLMDQRGQKFDAYVHRAMWINDQQLLITTRYEGLYIYDKVKNTILNRRHNPADPTSLANNLPEAITMDSTGWVFIGTTPNGISYFNQNAIIGQQLVFQDGKGNAYDGFITHLSASDNDTYYISALKYLIKWKRSTNASTFVSFPLPQVHATVDRDQVVYSKMDNLDHLWVATYYSGVYVFTKNLELIHHFRMPPAGDVHPLRGVITNLETGPDGWLWATTTKGLVRIDPVTYNITTFEDSPLKEIARAYCRRIVFFDDRYAWIVSSSIGVWQYDLLEDKVVNKFNHSSGLTTNEVFCFNKDNDGNLYFGTSQGLCIRMTDGKYTYVNEKSGLLNKRVEALLRDDKDRMWLGNDVALACYNISDSTLRVFDERYGLSIQGFRLNSYCQNANGELFWGTEKGLQYFYPDDMMAQSINLRTIIYKVESRDLNSYLTRDETFDLAPGNNFLSFNFSTIDYSKHLHTFYQYQLTGIDPDWINLFDQNTVRYNSLVPGTYTFRVRASNDRKSWYPAENEVVLHLSAYFWQTSWFQWLFFLTISGFLALFLGRMARRQKQKREELETENVIHYFASRINQHSHRDNMLWDVAKNCISKLHLNDCVIYVLDPERQVLVQKAAFGPKSTGENTITEPIEIPLGKGITGNVALTGKPEIVNQTEKDARYIVDDERRQSEMAVPIIVNGNVVGVIDSENPKRNFFTPKHLSLMTTISILTGNQMHRIQAEEEKQKAEIEVLQNKQKATESRLQSLRLQMNPHFLFNALNSIQQMILANEEMVATKYLSRFSKLLRSILIHSDKEMISLKEELDILKLYVELESVRFKEAFTYEIHCDEEIDTDEIHIPTLLIQPFVENAIWHGLMHKEGDRKLLITFTEEADVIRCVIQDNGIGRQRAKEMKISTGQDKKHTSKGIEVSLERLKTLQKNGGPPGSLEIKDLVDAHGQPLGTRVEIILPLQN